MKTYKLEDYTKGWIVGNFIPAIIKTSEFEVAIKKYKKGDYEYMHHHRVATEITIIISGTVMMNERRYCDEDIIVIDSFESTDFRCVTDVITCVIKMPSVADDKYEGDYFI